MPKHKIPGHAQYRLEVPFPMNPLPEAQAQKLFHKDYAATRYCCAGIKAPGIHDWPDMFASEVSRWTNYAGPFRWEYRGLFPTYYLGQ